MTPEEYIKAYTRGCSNELVYGGYHEWLTPENALAAVELAREEMMKDAIKTIIGGFRIGDKVRLKDGDGRPHIIKSFGIDGLKEYFIVVQFEDGTRAMLDNISLIC